MGWAVEEVLMKSGARHPSSALWSPMRPLEDHQVSTIKQSRDETRWNDKFATMRSEEEAGGGSCATSSK
jgi:hypothetical protein